MRRTIFILCFACVLAAGFGVAHYFNEYSPMRNPKIPFPVVNIFTHSSFMSPTGPGPELVQIFEQDCQCKVRLLDAGSGGLLLQKLKIVGGDRADVVVGLDQLQLKSAAMTVKWRPLSPPIRKWESVFENNHYPDFLPYDWSPLVFITKENWPNNGSLDDFVRQLPAKSLSLQNPRISTPGAQFLFWLYTHRSRSGLDQFLDLLSPKIFAVSEDWSAAYGLFRRGQAKAVFSYLTSLVYHMEKSPNENYHAMIFKEAHPAQFEYVGVPDTCMSCGLAERFVDFMTSTAAQKVIMQKNYMLPMIKDITTGTLFEKLPEVPVLDGKKLDYFLDEKESLVQIWESHIQK